MTPFAVFFLLVQGIQATCTASDGPCVTNSGTCSEAVALGIAGDLRGAANLLKYGKYCGGVNKCILREDATSAELEDNVCDPPTQEMISSKKGSKKGGRLAKNGKKGDDDGYYGMGTADPCPAIPCDTIDEACSVHDACLDAILRVDPRPSGERIPVPQRCQCDVDFVSSMAVQATSTEPTGLCDADFYSSPLFGVLGHEATLLAAPYCCDIILDQDGNGTPDCAEDANTNQTNYEIARPFCDAFLGKLKAFGISVC